MRISQRNNHLPIGLFGNAPTDNQSHSFTRPAQLGFDGQLDEIGVAIRWQWAVVAQQGRCKFLRLERHVDFFIVDPNALDNRSTSSRIFIDGRVVQLSENWIAFERADRRVKASRSKHDNASPTSCSEAKNARSRLRTKASTSPAGMRQPLAWFFRVQVMSCVET
jgi:hypothetical protein